MFLFVMFDVGLCKVVAGEDDIRPLAQELRHPEHVSTGRVQEADLVFVEDPLELISDAVEDLDHVSGVLVRAADTTHGLVGVTLVASPPRVIIFKETLPLLPGLRYLQTLTECLLEAVSPHLLVEGLLLLLPCTCSCTRTCPAHGVRVEVHSEPPVRAVHRALLSCSSAG